MVLGEVKGSLMECFLLVRFVKNKVSMGKVVFWVFMDLKMAYNMIG